MTEAELLERLEWLEREVKRITAKHPKVTPIEALPPGASAGNTIVKVNAIINRLQDTE